MATALQFWLGILFGSKFASKSTNKVRKIVRT